MTDIYQQRYEQHQEKKKAQLATGYGLPYEKRPTGDYSALQSILETRRSQRVFNREPITEQELDQILEAARIAPSSCNRHGVRLLTVCDREEKELLTGILVGGVGWVHRAEVVVLLFADPDAYKSPNEKEFMHYCDVGFTAMPMWLTAESLNIGCSYINPNIRQRNKELFYTLYPHGIFVGALAFGKYDLKADKPDIPEIEEIMI